MRLPRQTGFARKPKSVPTDSRQGAHTLGIRFKLAPKDWFTLCRQTEHYPTTALGQGKAGEDRTIQDLTNGSDKVIQEKGLQ